MNYYLKSSIVLGVLGALVYVEVQGDSHQHAQYIAASPTNNLVASGGFVSNVSASTLTYTYQPSPVTLEYLLPHDRLVIQTAGLTPPTVKRARSVSAKGANPLLQRRQRAPRMQVQAPKIPPLWCASFQKFRARMMTRKIT
jgi:hypothetical protein